MIKRIFWYVRHSNAKPEAVFLIIDSKVGLTVLDRDMLKILIENEHHVVIIANKIDKLGKIVREKKILSIKEELPDITIFAIFCKEKRG